MADRASIEREISYQEQRREECLNERRILEEKLERLEYAKRQLSDEKDAAKSLRKQMEKLPESYEENWQGEKYEWLCSRNADWIVPGLKTYRDTGIDGMLDEVCDEITRLENENRELGVVLGAIANSLNWLGNELEKLFN